MGWRRPLGAKCHVQVVPWYGVFQKGVPRTHSVFQSHLVESKLGEHASCACAWPGGPSGSGRPSATGRPSAQRVARKSMLAPVTDFCVNGDVQTS